MALLKAGKRVLGITSFRTSKETASSAQKAVVVLANCAIMLYFNFLARVFLTFPFFAEEKHKVGD